MSGEIAAQVLGGVGGHHSPSEGRNLALGNLCLLLNTLAMALYYLTCALRRRPWPADLQPALRCIP